MNQAIVLERVSGRIRNLSVSTVTVDVFITDADRAALKGTAAATVLAGSAGLGIGLLGLDTDTSSEADLMEFELEREDGSVLPVQACVWLTPFKDGDEVEIAGERIGDVWKGVAIARPFDRLVAVYPLCTHGRWAHWKKVAGWWWWISFFLVVTTVLLFYVVAVLKGDGWSELRGSIFHVVFMGGGGLFLIFGLIAWSIGRKVSKLVPLSEAIFRAFGWKNPRSFDLYATTKAKRRPDDPEPLGLSYFRY
ncbi:putative type VI secretion system effector [Luteimonas sp. MJ250]|uniref:putative type VI secretion system effector n=1 Tax=Luteimonas sp. MJ250 TaxID=3129236 RepID=UPI0031BA0FE0